MSGGYPKKLNGLCVGILSGDRVLFQGPLDKVNGGHKQKILHLSAISSPKVDPINGKDEKYGFSAREFLRKRLLGKTLPFVIEKKVNEIEVGYVLYEGKDISIELLLRGYARLRGEKINADNIESYKDAEEEAKMSESGVWSLQGDKAEGAFRYLNPQLAEKQMVEKYKNMPVKVLVEEIHPSKATVYFLKEGVITTINFSEVQVVVLSEKLENGESKNNVRLIRGILQLYFLQKEVELYFSTGGTNNSLNGHFFNDEGKDVRKVLLENGFAKLAKDAMSGVSTKEFMELKNVAQGALQDGKGLWKEQKVTKSETIDSKSYQAAVIEVHSGDCITIFNSQKNQAMRIYFPNIRAPGNNQPFSFQSKEALRRRIIGLKVRVETQFSKNINVKKFEGDVGELRNFTFATIFENNQNISAYMLENGFVSIQQIRVEEDMTKYFDDLRTAEDRGKKDRKGIHKGDNPKVQSFNDLSGGKGKKIDATKCKNIFPFLTDDNHLTGVIDLVLNGSRFKVRFNHQHVMAIMVLDGVRCLPNEGDFKKVSEEALIFSKQNAQQRDVDIQLKRVDQKGNFHGKIFINKKDYSIDLLEAGMAIFFDRSKNQQYEDAEAFAKKNKHGIWKYNLNLASIKGETEKEFRSVNFVKKLVLIDVISPGEFYLEPIGCVRPEVPQKPDPVQNVVVGEMYCAQFSDGTYYRAKVQRVNKGKFDVHYVDYGNHDTVDKKQMGVISEKLKKQKVQIYRCSLYGIDSTTREAANIIKDCIDTELKAEFKEQAEDGECKVILYQKDHCINLQVLEEGEGECTVTNESWQKAEEKARLCREGKWLKDDY